ncbi:TVP38/TMEM64 family protein [Adhaeretor mobilis]|uniref:TVP38/TMEM64 family membrane protein n=1 Tax=Adhaeretor mobilis TaxID=1930276 RepID=A0A517MRV0_9BACT|nr:VTT domain-containing protein [Adhaeretor mobilis]QDS97608.1 SNARE associated Golgi protein [Adhaeretor mobilis]
MLTDLAKPLLLVTVVLVLPLVVLAVWGESFSDQLVRWQESPPSAGILAAAIVALLASDVFLPIPSGPICTLAGSTLGIWLGALVSCIGMTIGATIAFALARRWGRPLAVRFSSAERVTELEDACRQHGPAMLAITRPLPVLAEACALLVGALQMPWRNFLATTLLCNGVLSLGYAALGQQATTQGWLPAALCISITLPLLGTWAWQRRSAS